MEFTIHDDRAKAFYETHGYTVFSQQNDFPTGHTQYYLSAACPWVRVRGSKTPG